MRASRVARVLATGLVAACTVAPPPTAAPSGVAATPAVTPSAAASLSPAVTAPATAQPTETAAPPPVLGDHWEPIARSARRGILAGVNGDAGMVLVGACKVRAHCAGGGAAAWFFDGSSWQSASIEDPEGAPMTQVAYGGRYVAGGLRLKGRTSGVLFPSVALWSSDDGRAWTSLGSLELDECDEENGCPFLADLATTQGGAIVVDVEGAASPAGMGLFRSKDGRHWTRIDEGTFRRSGGDDGITGLDGVGEDVLLAWMRNQSVDIWSGESGRNWQRIGTLNATFPSLVSDGTRLFAAGQNCRDECEMRLWSRQDGGEFRRVASVGNGVTDIRLAFTGQAGFLAVGDLRDRPGVWASADGEAWVERSPDIHDWECAVQALVGGPSVAILIDDCGNAWRTPGA
jgi:hypothetical protein